MGPEDSAHGLPELLLLARWGTALQVGRGDHQLSEDDSEGFRPDLG